MRAAAAPAAAFLVVDCLWVFFIRTDSQGEDVPFTYFASLPFYQILRVRVYVTRRTIIVRSSYDEATVRDLVQLSHARVIGTEEQGPEACARRAASGMLYADGAGIVSKSAEGLANIKTVIVTVFEAAGLTVSENKTETMLLRTPDKTTLTPTLAIEAAGHRYK